MGNKQSCINAFNIESFRAFDTKGDKSKKMRTNYISSLCGSLEREDKENKNLTNFSFEDESHNNPYTSKFFPEKKQDQGTKKVQKPNEYNLYPDEKCEYNIDLNDFTISDNEDITSVEGLTPTKSNNLTSVTKNFNRKSKTV